MFWSILKIGKYRMLEQFPNSIGLKIFLKVKICASVSNPIFNFILPNNLVIIYLKIYKAEQKILNNR